MARHARDYSGERLTARLHLQMTPSDRQAVADSAAEEGLSPSDFARTLLMNGLRAYHIGGPARAARRAAMARVTEALALAGSELNGLARKANEERRIQHVRSVDRVCAKLVTIMADVLPRSASRRKNPDLKPLIAELAAIGNNVRQLRLIAQGQDHRQALQILDSVETAMIRTLDAVMPA